MPKIINKTTLANILLLIVCVVLTFAVLEIVIEKYLVTRTPLKFQFALPEALKVLTQSSKKERIPEHYIALAGDSYAQGKGDWLLDSNPDSNPAYHSAHVLSDLSGHDVISFGKSGSGNLKGWAREPAARYRFTREHIDDSLEAPEIIFAYFYAGNDFMENVVDISDDFLPVYGREGLHSENSWREFFDNSVQHYKVGPFRGIDSNFGWLPRAVVKLIREELKNKPPGAELGDIQLMSPGKTNYALVNASQTALPDGLQSPGLELDDDEFELGRIGMQQALRYLQQRFSQSSIVVVYIPSVLESYEIASPQVSVENRLSQRKHLSGPFLYSRDELLQRSNEMFASVSQAATKLSIPVIDTRPAIRTASAKTIIHGPKDWLHFNRTGYKALAMAISCGMVAEKRWPETACQTLSR